MKRAVSLAIILSVVLLCSLTGILNGVRSTRAGINFPLRPVWSGSKEEGVSTTALGQEIDTHSVTASKRGTANTAYGTAYGDWSWRRPDVPDLEVNDGSSIGRFMFTTDFTCRSAGGIDYDIVATAASASTPYTFEEQSTDLHGQGLDWMLANLGPEPLTSRMHTDVNNVSFGGTVSLSVVPRSPLISPPPRSPGIETFHSTKSSSVAVRKCG